MSACKAMVVVGCIGWIGIAAAAGFGQTDEKAKSSGASDDEKKLATMANERHLIVLSNAEHVKYYRGAYGSVASAYIVHDPYPAKQTRGQIRERMSKLGWKELKEDWMNPGAPLSDAAGWSEFAKGETIPPSFYWQWKAQWVDKQGAVIHYTLRYGPLKNRSGKRDSLSVSGLWYGAAEAEKVRTQFGGKARSAN
jgi:hypothetical protein